MFPNEGAEDRIGTTGGGIGLRLFEDRFWIKTGKKDKSRELDGILAASQI